MAYLLAVQQKVNGKQTSLVEIFLFYSKLDSMNTMALSEL